MKSRLPTVNVNATLVARILVLCSVGVAALNAQEAGVQEPEYVNEFALLDNGGKLVPLEHEALNFEMKSKRNFVIAPKTTTERVVPEPKSPVRVSTNAHFVARLHTGGTDPATLISLRPFTVRKKDRELPGNKASAGVLPWSGVKSQSMVRTIAISVKKYGKDSFEIVPSQPLPAGEYAFVVGQNASCFGVDAK